MDSNEKDFEAASAARAKKAAARHSQRKVKSNTNSYIALSSFGGIVGVVIAILVLHPDLALDETPVNDPRFVETLNTGGLGFTAAPSDYFLDWTLEDAQTSTQVSLSPSAKGLSPCASYSNQGVLLPESFDFREESPICVEPVYLQGNCSSSYAISAASVMAERFCLESKGQIVTSLSFQELVSCDSNNAGCKGGYVDTVWNYIRDAGVVDSQCFPYTTYNQEPPECTEKCENAKKYKAVEICVTAGEEAVMREIKAKGPVVGLIPVQSDFLVYKAGVYRPNNVATKLKGNQAVEIMGWGNDPVSNEAYWLVKNSWGTDWGEEGYARVARGDKELQIADFVVTGVPLLSPNLFEAPEVAVENLDVQEDDN